MFKGGAGGEIVWRYKGRRCSTGLGKTGGLRAVRYYVLHVGGYRRIFFNVFKGLLCMVSLNEFG